MMLNKMLSSPQPTYAVPSSGPSPISSPSSTSSLTVELAPMNDITSLNKPDSCAHHLPAFLEPVPIPENYRCESTFVPRIFSSFSAKEVPSLVPSSASSCSSSTSSPSSPTMNVNTLSYRSNSPPYSSQIPCRHASLLQSIQPKPNSNNINNEPISRCPVAHQLNSSWPKESDHPMLDASGLPLSPTMMAASAAANAASAQNHAGSIVENTFLNSLSLSSNAGEEDNAAVMAAAAAAAAKAMNSDNTKQPSFARVSFMVHGAKRTCPMGADQRMFLTKNAHIKRPRNAWIHFRCHYGQALKSQDPTLRAEEISKRASRRWARLSENEKKPWHDLAEQDKQAHKAAFPEYRYCPRRSNTAAMLAAKSAQQQQEQCMKPNNSVYKSISSRV